MKGWECDSRAVNHKELDRVSNPNSDLNILGDPFVLNAPPTRRRIIRLYMDKLQLTGQNLGRVFNSRLVCAVQLHA